MQASTDGRETMNHNLCLNYQERDRLASKVRCQQCRADILNGHLDRVGDGYDQNHKHMLIIGHPALLLLCSKHREEAISPGPFL